MVRSSSAWAGIAMTGRESRTHRNNYCCGYDCSWSTQLEGHRCRSRLSQHCFGLRRHHTGTISVTASLIRCGLPKQSFAIFWLQQYVTAPVAPAIAVTCRTISGSDQGVEHSQCASWTIPAGQHTMALRMNPRKPQVGPTTLQWQGLFTPDPHWKQTGNINMMLRCCPRSSCCANNQTSVRPNNVAFPHTQKCQRQRRPAEEHSQAGLEAAQIWMQLLAMKAPKSLFAQTEHASF